MRHGNSCSFSLALSGLRFSYAITKRSLVGLYLSLAWGLGWNGFAQPGSLDRSFYPGSATDGVIYCVALQADGRMVIGGDFGIADNCVRNRIAQLNSDGLLDPSFGAGQAGANDVVRVVAVQSDGKILIAGDFSAINHIPRYRFARLNVDGSFDTNFAFTNNVQIYAILPQSDGRILVGSQEGIARLNQDGTLDTSFTNALVYPASVHSIAVQPDGNIIIGGSFWKVGGVVRTNIARIQSNGRLDPTFGSDQGGPNAQVNCVNLQPDGKVLLGGQFSTVNGVIERGLARLNSDGSLDGSFNHPFSFEYTTVSSMAVDGNGRIEVMGSLHTSTVTHNLARLNANGDLDSSFGYIDLESRAIALQPDEKTIIVGGFYSVKGVVRIGAARLCSDGSVDTNFSIRPTGPGAQIAALAVTGDNKVLVNCGSPMTPCGVGRIRPDGSFDDTFRKYDGLAGVGCIAIQNDGKIVVAGIFDAVVDGLSRKNIARLYPDGRIDPSFACSAIGNQVKGLGLQDDGKIVVGGDFGRGTLRLLPDGSVDATFTVTNSYATWVDCLAVQSDHKVVIGGTFDAVGPVNRGHIARLNSDGSLDTGFGNGLAGANSYVSCVAVDADGKVLLGGYFNTVNGVTRHRIARLNTDGSLDVSFGNGLPGADAIVDCLAVQADGKILIGGHFFSVNGVARTHLARLNSDGTLDQSFSDPNFNNSSVNAIDIAGDGTILVGGDFTAIGTLGQRYVARLYGDRPRLKIKCSGILGAAVFWPAGWADCVLEETCDLSLPWKNVQQLPINDGTNWTVTFPLSSGQHFRLKR